MLNAFMVNWLREQPWYDHSRDEAIHHCFEYISVGGPQEPDGEFFWKIDFLNHLVGHEGCIPEFKAATEARYMEVQQEVLAAVVGAVRKLQQEFNVPASTIYLPSNMLWFLPAGRILGMGRKVGDGMVLSQERFGRFVKIGEVTT